MKGEWFRKADGPATVVFTHGICSSTHKCFTAPNGVFWPRLVCDDEYFRNVGVFNFDYFTEVTAGRYSIDAAAQAMHLVLQNNGVLNSRALIFVAHSMGGLVVRRFLVARQAELHKRRTKIGLVLVASPSIGAGWANIVARLTFFIPHAERDALKIQEDGGWLDALNHDFRHLQVDDFLTISGVEMVENRFIKTKFFGFLPRIVSTIAGAQFFPDRQMIPDSDHFTISAPTSSESLQHVALRQFAKKFLADNILGASPAPSAEKMDNQFGESQPLLAYVERRSILERLNPFLKPERSGDANVVALVGASGVGKTTFMRKQYSELKTSSKIFLDCSANFERPETSASLEYLFLDNLSRGHPFLTNLWGTFGAGTTIISTNDISVAREFLSSSGVADQTDRIILCEQFTEVEVKTFLLQTCGSNDPEFGQHLYQITGGDPLALQVSRALLLELNDRYSFPELFPAVTVDDFVIAGFQHWISSRYDRDVVESIVTCLAVVPYSGMTLATLSSVLEKSPNELGQSIAHLIRLGLLKAATVCDGNAVVYSLPTVLRRAITENTKTELSAQWESRYLALLLSGELGNRLSFELIDAWLVGWQLLFSVEISGDEESFDARHRKHLELINAIIKKGKAFRSFVERNATSLLAGRTEGLDGENCAYVIGLAHLCDRLEPKNSLVAEHIWPGAYNRDGWARAACIRSATVHWEACGLLGHVKIKNAIQKWTEHALAKSAEERLSEVPLEECHWRLGEIDYCAAVSALCRIGEQACALELLTSEAYQRAFPSFSLAHVTVLIDAFDDNPQATLRPAIMSFLSLPIDAELPLADEILRLFAQKINLPPSVSAVISARPPGKKLNLDGVVQLALTVANQVRAKNFKKSLIDTYPNCGPIIF